MRNTQSVAVILCSITALLLVSCADSTAPPETEGSGELDLSFGRAGLVVSESVGEVQDIAIQPDGMILVAGNGHGSFSNRGDFMVTRYTAEGTPDATFGVDGVARVAIDGSTAHVTNFAVEPSGMITLSGKTGQTHAMVRFQQDGSPDDAFGTGGILITDVGISSAENPVAVQSSGTLIVAGVRSGQLTVNAYDSAGEPEEQFGEAGTVTIDLGRAVRVADVCILPDGRMVVVASADGDVLAVRFTAGGAVDSTFGARGTATVGMGDGFVAAKIVDQPDGRLVLTGSSGSVFDPVFVMLRLAADGSLDGTFGSMGVVREPDAGQTGLFELPGFPAVQSDGKIAVAGVGNTTFSFYRYTANGARDTGFGTMGIVTTDLGSTGGWDYTRAIGIQPDGRIVVAGCAASCHVAVVRYWP